MYLVGHNSLGLIRNKPQTLTVIRVESGSVVVVVEPGPLVEHGNHWARARPLA